MTGRYRFCRAALLAGAALLGLVAVTIVAGVVPPVKADLSRLATPNRAVLGFVANVLISLLVAVSMVGVVRRMTASARRRPRGTLALDAIIILVLALSLSDAASAYSDDAALQTACGLIKASVVADGLVVLLLLAVIALLPRPLPVSPSE